MSGFSLYSYLLWFCFSLCLAMTVLGVLSLIRMSGRNRYVRLPWLQYAWVMLVVFGFYGIWSRIIVPALLDVEVAVSITPLVAGMAMPFLFLGQLMLVGWLFLLREKKLVVPMVTVVCGWVAGIVLAIAIDTAAGDFFSLISFITGVVSTLAAVVSVMGEAFPMKGRAALVFRAGLAGSALFYLANWDAPPPGGWAQLGMVLLYFFSHTLMLVTYLYCGGSNAEPVSFEGLLGKYQVTPRETQVVQGIFDGKTNQEIADSLFISLQTVKDHTSRIYQKVQVKNRTQLVALLREAISKQ